MLLGFTSLSITVAQLVQLLDSSTGCPMVVLHGEVVMQCSDVTLCNSKEWYGRWQASLKEEGLRQRHQTCGAPSIQGEGESW